MHPNAANAPVSAGAQHEVVPATPARGPTALPVRTVRQRPGPATRETSLLLGPVATASRCARATLIQSLKLWGLPHLSELAEVITGELVVNAITASRDVAPPGIEPVHIVFCLAVEDGELRIRIWDPDPAPPPADPTLPGDDAESGRGLFIVAALSKRWGWYPATNGGKYVWASCALDAEPSTT